MGAKVMVCDAAPTTMLAAAEVLAAELPDPAYAAVTASVPVGNRVVVRTASPLPFSVPVPRGVEPLKKVTVPLGVPKAEVTVALSVVVAPKAAVPGALNIVVVAMG